MLFCDKCIMVNYLLPKSFVLHRMLSVFLNCSCSYAREMEEMIDSSSDILMTVFVDNDFDSVISMCEPFVHNSVYHSALKAKISMLKAGLTLNKVVIIDVNSVNNDWFLC